jgi:anaerobic selenocysteine-containing dehydrogenase
MKQLVLNRRDFLKATAVTGIAATFGGSLTGFTRCESATTATATTSTTKIVKTCCRACIGKCGVLAHVKDGRVIKLEGDPDQPMSKGALCAKGLAGIQALYHPNRNKYPMQRVGARGENKWKRISWDEAIDIIAKKLMETREKYGAESVFGSTGGGGNPEFMSVGRFCNVFGTPNFFEPGASQCLMPRTLAFDLIYGTKDRGAETPCNSIADGRSLEIYFPDDTPMKTLVLWGTAPSNNSPSQGGRAVVELRAKGVHTVVVDPRLTPDAAKADVWLSIRPGTDVALMFSWIRYILENKLYDAEIVMKWSNLPFLVNTKTNMCLRESDLKAGGDSETYVVWDQKTKSAKPLPYPWDDNLAPALEGTFTVNGIECKTGFQLLKERVDPYTLEKAAEICWLDPNMIKKAIKLYAEGTPSGLCLGVATDQNPNSVQAAMGSCILDLIMGNVERPGSLLQNFKGSGFPDATVSPLVMFLPEEQFKKRLGGIEYKGMLSWTVAHNPSILAAIKTGKPYKPRVWLERSGNKLATLANASEWAEGMQQLDFIVHMYMYPTSFSAYADILLPAMEWLESDYVITSLNTLFVRQAVTHLWETMNETVFWSKLAKRCAELGHEGCKNAFDPKKTAPELPYWDSQEEYLDANCKNLLGMTFAELVKKVPYEFAPYKEWRQYYTYKRIDPQTGKPEGFATRSKKLEIYGEAFITLGRTGAPYAPYPLPPASKDYDPLPYYLEPFESPLEGSELAKKYPLVMTNGRLPFFHHSTLRNIPWLREIYPVSEIWIHPDAALTYGISQGDWVWVESQRGKIQAKAYVTEGIHPGVVYMERFWNPETLDTNTHGWREMNVNILSKNDAPFNDIAGTYTLRGYLVKVSKADGPPKGIWQKPEEFKAWLPEPSDPTKTVEV